MTYPGFALALIVGMAVGSFIYYCFTQETPQAYDNGQSTRDHPPMENSWNTSSRSASSSQRRRRRLSCSSCSICLEPLMDTATQVLKCRHEFHSSCVQEWLEYQRICPNCRCNV